jgi:hypothetical protein
LGVAGGGTQGFLQAESALQPRPTRSW